MHVVAQVCVGVKGCGIGKPEECLAYARRDTLHPRRVVHFGGVHEGLVHCRAHEVARRKVTRCTAERHERELAHFVCDLMPYNVPIVGTDKIVVLHDLRGAGGFDHCGDGLFFVVF
ncbi:unknown [Anaerotruncus sp. CAG:390]|nr:unknown [Anaerotruncus sp. CAG:390]